jgi:predicted Zn-dependent protease
MRTNRWRRPLTVALLAMFVFSCATTKLPPISSAGEAFEPLKDERRLWESAWEEEGTLQENIVLYDDPLLIDYLDDVVARLNPSMMAANPEITYRVRVIEDPTLNAFAYPHGSLYLHTGLLARMENEDQLATVLAHEMTHVEGRHMLRHRRSAQNKQIGFSIAAIAAAVVVAGEMGDSYSQGKYGQAARIGVLSDILVGLGLQLAFMAAVNGYGRNLEAEADAGAFEKMQNAGYNTAQAPLVFEKLMEEHGDSGKTEAFFFGSHPRLANRIESAELWLAANPDAAPSTDATGAEDPDRFMRRIRTVIRDDARLNIEMGRLELAEHELTRSLELMPEDPETHLLLGKLQLAQSEATKDEEQKLQLRMDAMSAFRESIRLDPDRPATHRELGVLAYRHEEFETACVQFRQYLELDPQAEDAQRIRDYLLELERDRRCP